MIENKPRAIVLCSAIATLCLLALLFVLKWRQVTLDPPTAPHSQYELNPSTALLRVGDAFLRRGDDVQVWANVIMLWLCICILAGFSMPEMRGGGPDATRTRLRMGPWMWWSFVILMAIQTLTYFWTAANPWDPGTFYWKPLPSKPVSSGIVGLQFWEGIVDLLLIIANQLVVIVAFKACGMLRNTGTRKVHLPDSVRLRLALLLGLGVTGGVVLAVAYHKLFGADLAAHEPSPPAVLVAIVAFRIWPVCLIGIVLLITVLLEFPVQLVDALKSRLTD